VAEAFVRCGGRGLHFRHKHAASLLFARGACSSAASQAPLRAQPLRAAVATACGSALPSIRPASRCDDDTTSDRSCCPSALSSQRLPWPIRRRATRVASRPSTTPWASITNQFFPTINSSASRPLGTYVGICSVTPFPVKTNTDSKVACCLCQRVKQHEERKTTGSAAGHRGGPPCLGRQKQIVESSLTRT
jgi:hypothetical protein